MTRGRTPDGEQILDGRGQEFEDRNRQEPGTAGNSVSNGSAIESVRASLRNAQTGTPPNNCDVRSVFDSRPIDAYDFNLIGVDPAE